MSVSRRKSLDFLTAFAEEAARPSPSLFNLRDLALLGLQSANRQTMLATLRLLSVVLQRHHSFARSLIRTLPGRVAKQRSIGALNAELHNLLTMASSIVHNPTVNDSYENYLRDSSFILESRLCVPDDPDDPSLPLELDQNDPIVQELLRCLENFFSNSVIVNLALTEVLMSIASSHLVSLDNWLLVSPTKYSYPTPAEEPRTGDLEDRIRHAYQEPTWSKSDTPTFTSALQNLVSQTQRWKENIPDFNILVAARRDILHREEENISPLRSPQVSEPATRSSSQRPQRGINPESDVGSPRGRTRGVTSPRAAVGSPLRNREPSAFSTASRESSTSTSQKSSAEELKRRLAMPIAVDSLQPDAGSTKKVSTDEIKPQPAPEAAREDEQQPPSDNQEPTTTATTEDEAVENDEPAQQTATLGHILTNTVILYEFLLELSAMVQVRGSLFEEAGFLDLEPEIGS